MATEPKKNDKKGLSGVLSSFTGAIDEIVDEVKRDLREMTPPEKKANPAQKRQNDMASKAAELGKLFSPTGSGIAEDTVAGAPPEPESPAWQTAQSAQKNLPKPVLNLDLPSGNLWHHLANAAQSTRLRADACYQALTAADVETYARAIGNENKPPYTLGLVAVSLPALTDEDLEIAAGENALDVLGQTLLKTLSDNPRLFGIIGAGPRQLWPDSGALDTFLTDLLNTHRKLVALGPIGIDETFAPYTVEQQKAQMALQLEMAKDFGIPALLTCRSSHAAMHEVLKAVKNRVGTLPPLVYLDALTSADDMELVNAFDCMVLLRPEITKPDFAGRAFYKQIPTARLLLASGSALVAPHGFAGHFNQPKFLDNTIQSAASLRGEPMERLMAAVNANLSALFKLV
jgi:Tat protein secretion system quality control protein TatD with DNase activity